jgi:hypothetical protein
MNHVRWSVGNSDFPSYSVKMRRFGNADTYTRVTGLSTSGLVSSKCGSGCEEASIAARPDARVPPSVHQTWTAASQFPSPMESSWCRTCCSARPMDQISVWFQTLHESGRSSGCGCSGTLFPVRRDQAYFPFRTNPQSSFRSIPPTARCCHSRLRLRSALMNICRSSCLLKRCHCCVLNTT